MLNREAPDNPITEFEEIAVEEIEVDTGEIIESEVEEAIKKTKNGKASGVDQITAELIKADKETAVTELTKYSERCGKRRRYQTSGRRGLL